MKKMLFFLLVSNFFFAQQFKKLDSLQFKQAIETLVSDTGKKYEPIPESENEDKDVFKFVNADDKSDVLYIQYYTVMEGENKDLEIKGVKTWNIRTLYGKYLSLFPLWKKYIDPNADAEKISNKEYAIIRTKYSISKIKDGFWRLLL
ncbi:hypothetical protein ATE49_13260 [Elizabethkingia miricola]|uniref:DUF4468 domain-containing protein n=1 Tax=Elizabethkingia miricola TaxID=172045 RepID=A0ABY3NC45_ELIMR|nr:hypothetical protein [Elizabethkingia miricola]OBS13407.1 hypothetical protein ATE49_13260 [Elizabethkingia miricola]TYO84891.1 hypothetical protein LX74_03696 [Elizabethkingia miricola]